MNQADRCSECGATLTAESPGGLCARCLLKRGLETNTLASVEATLASAADWTPPSVAEMGMQFAELEVQELIGRGGMGAVYKARQKNLDRIVALKILPPEIGRSAEFAERFAREAQAMAKLSHPRIVPIHDFGQRGNFYYFIMEYMDGLNLRQLMSTGNVSPKEALAIVPQICEALQFAHDQGIVHRDIKPENILLNKRGEVKIADFGLAKLMGPEAAIGTEKVCGTPRYMAPEQVSNPAEVDHRADIYSLGVVFYQMLTGQLPGKILELPSRKVQIDVRLDEIVLRALDQSPQLRFQNATQFKTEVETVMGASAADHPANPISDGIMTPKKPSRRKLVAFVLLIVAGVLALGLWIHGLKDEETKPRDKTTSASSAIGVESESEKILPFDSILANFWELQGVFNRSEEEPYDPTRTGGITFKIGEPSVFFRYGCDDPIYGPILPLTQINKGSISKGTWRIVAKNVVRLFEPGKPDTDLRYQINLNQDSLKLEDVSSGKTYVYKKIKNPLPEIDDEHLQLLLGTWEIVKNSPRDAREELSADREIRGTISYMANHRFVRKITYQSNVKPYTSATEGSWSAEGGIYLQTIHDPPMKRNIIMTYVTRVEFVGDEMILHEDSKIHLKKIQNPPPIFPEDEALIGQWQWSSSQDANLMTGVAQTLAPGGSLNLFLTHEAVLFNNKKYFHGTWSMKNDQVQFVSNEDPLVLNLVYKAPNLELHGDNGKGLISYKRVYPVKK